MHAVYTKLSKCKIYLEPILCDCRQQAGGWLSTGRGTAGREGQQVDWGMINN